MTDQTAPPPLAGTTRLFAILGNPIHQVQAPRLLNAAFAKSRRDAVCIPAHVPAPALPVAFAGLAAIGNLDGVIFTVPHKQAAAALVDRLTARARAVGAINVARRDADGSWLGDNLDGEACFQAMSAAGLAPDGRRLHQIGAGGAGRAIAHRLAAAGIGALDIADLDPARATDLAAALRPVFPAVAIRAVPADQPPAGADVVVNATPLGMAPGDPAPCDVHAIAPAGMAVDIILTPPVSRWLDAARARGLKTVSGAMMIAAMAEPMRRFLLGTDP